MLRIVVNKLMTEEINNKCGEKYNREKHTEGRYSHCGSNPGSIRIGEKKIPIEVPRYYDNIGRTARNTDIYKKLREQEAPTETLIKSILLGLSQKNYIILNQIFVFFVKIF